MTSDALPLGEWNRMRVSIGEYSFTVGEAIEFCLQQTYIATGEACGYLSL
jgi:hypothetical protein